MRSDLVPVPTDGPWMLVDVQGGDDADSSRIAVFGDLDHPNAAHLRDAVARVLSDQHPGRLELDLAGVPFLDTGGIRALLDCRARAQRVGCGLTVSNVRPDVHRVLDIVGLVEHFGVPRR